MQASQWRYLETAFHSSHLVEPDEKKGCAGTGDGKAQKQAEKARKKW